MTSDLVIDHLPLKKSIASRLFGIVFSIYFIVTLCLTIIQMVTEYNHTKHEIFREMKLLVSTIEPILGKSIWDIDMPRAYSVIDILSKQSIVESVEIEDEKGTLIMSATDKALDRQPANNKYQKHINDLNRNNYLYEFEI